MKKVLVIIGLVMVLITYASIVNAGCTTVCQDGECVQCCCTGNFCNCF